MASSDEDGGLLARCEVYFKVTSLYQVFAVENDVTDVALKKAYRKAALKVHPDRVQGEQNKLEATKKFQTLSQAYKFLSDDECRKIYDETGIVDEERSSLDKETGKSWSDYFREMFPKVSIEIIEKDKKRYQNSKDEYDDVKKAYLEANGDMENILSNVVHCTIADEDRFRKLIDEMIAKGEVKQLKKFSKKENEAAKSKRKKRAAEEELEAEVALKAIQKKLKTKTKTSPENDLFAAIRANQSKRGSAIDAIEAKFCAEAREKKSKSAKSKSKPKSKSKSKSNAPPSEEEYMALQKKLFNK